MGFKKKEAKHNPLLLVNHETGEVSVEFFVLLVEKYSNHSISKKANILSKKLMHLCLNII